MAAKNGDGKSEEYREEMIGKLADRIRVVRKEKGFTNYEKFANRHNISRSQMGKFEKGQNMTFMSLVLLLDAMEMTLAEFFSQGFDK